MNDGIIGIFVDVKDQIQQEYNVPQIIGAKNEQYTWAATSNNINIEFNFFDDMWHDAVMYK